MGGWKKKQDEGNNVIETESKPMSEENQETTEVQSPEITKTPSPKENDDTSSEKPLSEKKKRGPKKGWKKKQDEGNNVVETELKSMSEENQETTEVQSPEIT